MPPRIAISMRRLSRWCAKVPSTSLRRKIAGDNGSDRSGLKRLLDDSPYLAIRNQDPSGQR